MMQINYFPGRLRDEVPVFPDFISRCVIYAEGMVNYKVVQDGKSHVTVYLERQTPELQEAVEREFERLAEKMQFYCPKLTFQMYQNDWQRKMKRVERRLD